MQLPATIAHQRGDCGTNTTHRDNSSFMPETQNVHSLKSWLLTIVFSCIELEKLVNINIIYCNVYYLFVSTTTEK